MDARSWSRHIVEKEVPCIIGEIAVPAFLYDLCAGGCMIELGDSRSAVGERVIIDLYELETACGEVVWQSGRCVGVRFDVPVHDAVVRHVGFTPPSLSFEEQAPRDRFGRVLPPLAAGEQRQLGL
ncbi:MULTISPECIES: PilZ domain-containing protein [unclassified Novosphingobium]|uniref:PilZ domain-containing protein n=1 Tax=unclassified Novosphingobium TaxID=2644732 RepID=UPI00135AAAE9|nr:MULTISPECIES: PilZ domain-containing protein [unclassified Novosphingobium]